MTYCVGILLESGLVMASDSRTNAGLDHIANFPKMHLYSQADRVIVIMTSGNLAISQAVTSLLQKQLTEEIQPNLYSVSTMVDAVKVVGEALRFIHQEDADHLKKHATEFNQAILIGGQIKGEHPRLFNVYAAGNFIEAVSETPYFQIGETKYGKPILDRVVDNQTDLNEAAKCTLISFDSTIRSNLSVGMPIDLFLYRTDSFDTSCKQRITEHDAYFNLVRKSWSDGLKKVFAEIPDPDWC